MWFQLTIYKLVMFAFDGVAMLINKFRVYPKGHNCIKNLCYNHQENFEICEFDIHLNDTVNHFNSVIFFFHGGGFMCADKSLYHPFCAELSALGHIVINVNYRLVPEVTLNECIDDCRRAVEFALEKFKDFKNQKVIFSGDSAGAYIAMRVAEKMPCDGVIGYYGLYDLEAFKDSGFFCGDIIYYALFGEDYKLDQLSKYNLTNNLLKNLPEILLVSGMVDCLHKNQTIPLKERLQGLNKYPKLTFYGQEIKSARHGFLVYPHIKPFKRMPKIVDKFIRSIV